MSNPRRFRPLDEDGLRDWSRTGVSSCRAGRIGRLLDLLFFRADLIDHLIGRITLRLGMKLLLLGSRDIVLQTLMLGDPFRCVGLAL